MPYDPTTDAGRVRLLVADTDNSNAVFADIEIDAFLEMEDGNVLLAAAQALDTIATNEALIQKVAKHADTTTDGAKLAEALMKRAKTLRDRAAEVDVDGDDDFAVAEFADPVFGQREFLERHWAEM